MENCLRRDAFDRTALLGRIHLFSIRAKGARATLALRVSEGSEVAGRRIDAYEISDLRGRRNSPPSPECSEEAHSLVERLNACLPVVLPANEIRRRREIRSYIEALRSFNADPEIANERWRQLYVKALPGRFKSLTPAEIVTQ